jgi:transcriptional regulator
MRFAAATLRQTARQSLLHDYMQSEIIWTDTPVHSMKTQRRISLVKEDRIWNLREQGYCYETIARIVNCHPSLTHVIRRIRRRPPYELDPIRRGRRNNFLSDSQIEDIRQRRDRGETYLTIAKSYDVSETAIGLICRGQSYKYPESGYPFNFSNRLMRH